MRSIENTEGDGNTAVGLLRSLINTTGNANTANGRGIALFSNTIGTGNRAVGSQALLSNTTGGFLTPPLVFKHSPITHGGLNTAVGDSALFSNTTGSGNIALGMLQVANLTTAIRILISATLVSLANLTPSVSAAEELANEPPLSPASAGQPPAVELRFSLDPDGKLGTLTSSTRFKEGIKPMDKASEAILALKPVTFRYKHEIDPDGIPQFGLVAEEVEKVNPDLVARDDQGKPYTVRYEAVNAMLLNEFLKEHRRVQELEATIADLRSAMARQRKDFETTKAQQQKQLQTLAVGLKEQAAQIQKVSDHVELSKTASQLVVNSH